MTSPDYREVLGIIGGTGAQGKGLAARWARAGHEVWIGSRSKERGEESAAEIRERAGSEAVVHGGTNADAAEAAEIVVVSVPFDAQQDLLPPLRDIVGDKVTLNVVNPMTFDDRGPVAVPVEAGSAAEENQELWPDARLVSAFHDVSSRRLWRVDEPIVTHVLICGDDEEAAHRVAHLASRIEGMWGVYCGPLRNSEYIENITPVLLSINRLYKIQAGILIDGIERDEQALHAHKAAGSARAGRKSED
ncbi:MAG: NADPH-dependent F420 reductase [Nitriliruptorales bacterium]|nr:NADPH-dependent F420 reductase [Nitriliruptorales bacterium]